MTSSSTWKGLERKVARVLGGSRNPLSGADPKTGSSGDILHDEFYVEVKYRAKHAVVSLYEDTKTKAKAEDKLPLVVVKQRQQIGELVVLDLGDFVAILAERDAVCPECEDRDFQ